MQMILNSAHFARASGNSGSRGGSASGSGHISAAKPQAFVNEWPAPHSVSRLLSLLRQGGTMTIDADCNKGGETLYTGAFEIEPALAVSA
jgi:hypothetical protein